jgi:hypothetical protein
MNMPAPIRLALISLVVASLYLTARADDSSTVPAPAAITIHMTSMSPTDVIAELNKQTDAGVQVWPENMYDQNFNNNLPRSIDVNLDQATFWTSVDAICTAAALFPQPMGNNSSISLQQAGGRSVFGKRPQSVGPLSTILVDSVMRNHTIAMDSDNPQVQRSCGVQLIAYVDPRIRMLKFQNQPEIDRADDDNGQAIYAPPKDQPGEQDAYTRWQTQNIFVPLDYDPQTSHKLSVLKGSIKAIVAAEVAKIEFTDIANAKETEKEAGGVKVVCEDVNSTDNSFEMKVNIIRTDMPRENFRTLYGKIFQEGKFTTADGKRLQVSGGGGGDENRLNYSLQCNFSNPSDKPTKMTWEITTRQDQMDLPFEFHDIPLP